MSYYGYQYKQQCYIPGGMKSPAPAFPQQCHSPGLVTCGSCSPCAPAGAKLCTVRKALASPRCRQGCVETHLVEGHHSSSSSCSSSRCLDTCPAPFPQPLVQGRELGVPRCGQGVLRCPQVCGPAPVGQDSSCPYSYQWSNSYQYNCGQ
uniref:Epidermal differentiation protein n=1 Tax=Cyanistes caeruleus TaxID=156563 RepID=A0A8C0UC30_CYACU